MATRSPGTVRIRRRTRPPAPVGGPHDAADVDATEATEAPGTVDFGAVRVPVPARGTVDVEPATDGRLQAVHIALPEGRLSVSALAAPKSSALWPELVKEIEASLRTGGARVRSFSGDWGRELHATTDSSTSVFVGVDGPRWMLYGVATGPTRDADALEDELRRTIRGTVVVRGRSPYPVRTVLPLVVPEELAAEVHTDAAVTAGPVISLRTPEPALRTTEPTEPRRTDPGQPAGLRPAAPPVRSGEQPVAPIGRTAQTGDDHLAAPVATAAGPAAGGPTGSVPPRRTRSAPAPAIPVFRNGSGGPDRVQREQPGPPAQQHVAGPHVAGPHTPGPRTPGPQSRRPGRPPVAGPPARWPDGAPLRPVRGSRRPDADVPPLWADPVHRIADLDGPTVFGLELGPDPDRAADPAAVAADPDLPTELWPALRPVDPWALAEPPPGSTPPPGNTSPPESTSAAGSAPSAGRWPESGVRSDVLRDDDPVTELCPVVPSPAAGSWQPSWEPAGEPSGEPTGEPSGEPGEVPRPTGGRRRAADRDGPARGGRRRAPEPDDQYGTVEPAFGAGDSRPGRRRASEPAFPIASWEPAEPPSSGWYRAPEPAGTPGPRTGRRRAPESGPAESGPAESGPAESGPGAPDGRRRLAEPERPGRRRVPDGRAPAGGEPIVSASVRAGRHAADDRRMLPEAPGRSDGTALPHVVPGRVERTGRHHRRADR